MLGFMEISPKGLGERDLSECLGTLYKYQSPVSCTQPEGAHLDKQIVKWVKRCEHAVNILISKVSSPVSVQYRVTRH